MRETFSRTLHATLADAQQEARDLNQEFVGTEHLVLGMLRCGDCEAVRVLQRNHVAPEVLRGSLLKGMPRADQPPSVVGTLPLSPRSQRAVNLGLVKAQSLRQPRVTTRLLLLSLLDEVPTLLRDALCAAGADMDQLVRTLSAPPEVEEP